MNYPQEECTMEKVYKQGKQRFPSKKCLSFKDIFVDLTNIVTVEEVRGGLRRYFQS